MLLLTRCGGRRVSLSFGDMKIGSVITVYPPYRGGMGAVAQREMRAMRARGLEVEVFTADPLHDQPFEDKGVTPLRPLFRTGNASVLPQLLWKLRTADIIHLHYPFYGGALAAALAAVLWRKPLAITYHMKAQSGDWRNIIFQLHRWTIEPILMRLAKMILVSSLDYARSVGLRYKTLRESPFGVDTDLFHPDDRQRDQEQVSFLFVGGMDRAHDFKGIPELLKAMATLPNDGWQLTLVGDGDLRSSYESLAQTYGINQRVRFTGSLSPEDLIYEYQKADVHLLPSTNQSEAFGLVTLEAGACGCASIVSDLPGVRTLVQDGKTGYIVKPGHVGSLSSALMRCLDDPQRVYEMGEAARRRIEQEYSQKHVMDHLYENWHRL